MQYFAPLQRSDIKAKQTLRSGQYRRRNKRHYDEDDEDSEDPISTQADADGQSATAKSQLDSIDLEELRVAGLLPEDLFEIPAPPFPHAPARASKGNNYSDTRIQQELASLDPPLFAVKATSKHDPVEGRHEQPALRQQHLVVLTTILHRCLLEGDYHRAGRAWGLILRSQIAGKLYDLRSHARWGIGAEILLRRNNMKRFEQNATTVDVDASTDDLFSETGFQLAREYYERLIVQYPHYRWQSHSVDERMFYPAMFSLWVFEISEKSKRRRLLRTEQCHQMSPGLNLEKGDILPLPSDVVMEELAEALELTDRMDQLLMSPPFDKQADLLQLRGMVGLWVGDLVLANQAAKQMQKDGDVGMQSVQEDDSTGAAYSDAKRAFERARDYLERAQACGCKLGRYLDSTEARIGDLTAKMDNMNR